MELKHLAFKAHVMSADDEGTIEAIVSVFDNVDSYKDRVKAGFFQKSLEKKLPKGVWMHDWSRPVAKTLEAKELSPGDPLLPENLKELGGLYIKGQFVKEITDSWQAYLCIKNGLVDEYSFGYKTTKETKADDGTNELIEGEMYEWSPVLIGANRETQTLSVKQDLSAMPVGASLDEHTELLADRWEKNAEDRDSKGELTPDFFTRLGNAAQKMLGIIEKFKPRDGETKATTESQVEIERIVHAARLRKIRG